MLKIQIIMTAHPPLPKQPNCPLLSPAETYAAQQKNALYSPPKVTKRIPLHLTNIPVRTSTGTSPMLKLQIMTMTTHPPLQKEPGHPKNQTQKRNQLPPTSRTRSHKLDHPVVNPNHCPQPRQSKPTQKRASLYPEQEPTPLTASNASTLHPPPGKTSTGKP